MLGHKSHRCWHPYVGRDSWLSSLSNVSRRPPAEVTFSLTRKGLEDSCHPGHLPRCFANGVRALTFTLSPPRFYPSRRGFTTTKISFSKHKLSYKAILSWHISELFQPFKDS